MPATNGTTSSSSIPPSLTASYSSSGFAAASPNGHSLPFGPHPALVIIDVCDAYLTPGSPLYAPERFDVALASTERLITACREASIPLIFTRVEYASPSAGGNWYAHKIPAALSCFDKGNKLGDFPVSSAICRPQSSEMVLTKQFSSSFFGTPLATQLRGLGVDTLIICGYSTSGCVRATTVDAMQYGFFPWVVRDACGDRHEYPHEANLFDIQAKFGEVVGEEEMIRLIGDLNKKK